jgi:hypothetical protein
MGSYLSVGLGVLVTAGCAGVMVAALSVGEWRHRRWERGR